MSILKERLDEHVHRVARRLAIDIDQRVVLKTPVDTGRARANWLVGVGAPRRDTTTTIDRVGAKSIVDGSNAIARSEPYQDIWISNNLPYIGELENGSSKQAPEGMARLSVLEATSGNR